LRERDVESIVETSLVGDCDRQRVIEKVFGSENFDVPRSDIIEGHPRHAFADSFLPDSFPYYVSEFCPEKIWSRECDYPLFVA
jgi:hypothetical protein